ncbi:hypothetical protein AZE42_09202 [Rhizopogon vesiculosus]|uniref:Uncharacterized protein n=1 Tax=Rhizopogon vesiculosus TaxID=180088 RepID=A0A1J8R835_9AGAM|nr:hypothetical protein AZE42_09202 [Rhizopogon vesiculosus]
MTPLPGVNAKSLHDVDSTIPTRRHEPARRDSPRYNDNFWGAPDVTRPKTRDNIVVSDTPRASTVTGTRFSIPQYVKRVQVAAARMRMPSTVTRLRSSAAAPVDVPPSPKTATDRLFFHTQRQQSTPRDPAIDQHPQRTLTAESRTLSIHVRPTRLVKTLLYMGCIPETGD